MKYKLDWPEARERWTALWEGRRLDRPLICATAPRETRCIPPKPRSGRQKYLDPDFNRRWFHAQLESTHFGGEAIPSFLLNGGWVASCYGARPHFNLHTIWFESLPFDWDAPPAFDLDWKDVWFRRYETLHRAIVGLAGKDDFMVGQVCLLPASDVLALLLGGEQFLLALVERPDWVRRTLRKLTENWCAIVGHFHLLTAATNDFWYGNAGWARVWGPEPFVSTQSDISCMLSPEMFAEFILPELDLVGQRFGRVWYHLDGPPAHRHLPALCSREYLRVIQWVPGAGQPPNGPAYLDLYRTIQRAGKILHIYVPMENIESIVRSLDPSRLIIETTVRSVREANELLAAARHWAGRQARV